MISRFFFNTIFGIYFYFTSFFLFPGQSAVKFDRLAAGANTTHALVLRPTKFGYFNFTSAEVTYRVSEEEDSETKIGFSSEPGQGVIIALKDYDRQFSAHTVSWTLNLFWLIICQNLSIKISYVDQPVTKE